MASVIIFWVGIAMIGYSYIGYPMILFGLSLIIHRRVTVEDIVPYVTILISAYNEEKAIGRKIRNCLELDYPNDKLEIVVASDGSTDKTDDIVKSYEDNEAGIPVSLHRVEGRLGKTAAQNSAVRVAKGEIIVFSDAASMYDGNAIRAMVGNYADPKVGAVSGMYEYVNRDGSSTGLGTILFWKLENAIKKRQSSMKTITGCCGCIYSVRKELYTELPPEIISDLVEPLTILRDGYRIVFEPKALAFEETAGRSSDEFKMRIRVIVRGMNGMLFVRELFNPRKYPFVAFQLISHKIVRWLVPVFSIMILVSNVLLFSESLFFKFMLFGQFIFYGMAASGLLLESAGRSSKVLYLPQYFCTVNLAALISLVKVLRRENIVTWQTKR